MGSFALEKEKVPIARRQLRCAAPRRNAAVDVFE